MNDRSSIIGGIAVMLFLLLTACSSQTNARSVPTTGANSLAGVTTAPPTATPTPIATPRAAVPPCFGANERECREPSEELKSTYANPHSCDGTGSRKVCFLPIGNVPVAQIEALRAYFLKTYGLSVDVLPPWTAADALGSQVNQTEWKMSYQNFATELENQYRPLIDNEVKIIGITPVDMHFDENDEDSFVFGAKSTKNATGEGDYGLISTFRMNPETFGEPADDELWFSRIRKLVTKYVGLEYYDLAEDENPASPMFRGIYSLRALDAMTGDLPVAFGSLPAPPRTPLASGTAEDR